MHSYMNDHDFLIPTPKLRWAISQFTESKRIEVEGEQREMKKDHYRCASTSPMLLGQLSNWGVRGVSWIVSG